MYPPYVLAYPFGSETDIDTVGFTLDGILQVIVFVALEHTFVSPLYVVIVSLTVTLVPVLFCCASDSGGVHAILVLPDFDTIVPDALPHVYVIVCVKLLDCRVTESVCSVPSVPLDALRLLHVQS